MRIAVLGQGAWGCALSATWRLAGGDVIAWSRASDDRILSGAEIVVLAVPAQATRPVLDRVSRMLPANSPLILTAKGLEIGTLLRQSRIAEAFVPGQPLGVLSGPGFASDLLKELPTAVTLATGHPGGTAWQSALSTGSLRIYLSDDVIGVELGGALKNVVAIACGVAMGAGLGESARAALMARGFAEMTQIGIAAGARPETMAGLSGLGDLALTATSEQSRNYRLGLALGASGRRPGDGTFEGASSAGAAVTLAGTCGLETPLIRTVAALVSGTLSVSEAIQTVFNRPLRRE